VRQPDGDGAADIVDAQHVERARTLVDDGQNSVVRQALNDALSGHLVQRETDHRYPRFGTADQHHQRQRPQRDHQVVEDPVQIRVGRLHGHR
jgi:hypothetical protein